MPWAFRRYPDIRNMRTDGRVSDYGRCHTVGLESPISIELLQRIDRVESDFSHVLPSIARYGP